MSAINDRRITNGKIEKPAVTTNPIAKVTITNNATNGEPCDMMGGGHSTSGVFLPKIRHNLHCIMRTQQTDLSHRPFDITKSSTTSGL